MGQGQINQSRRLTGLTSSICAALLALVSTWGLNRLYGFGGRRETVQVIDPLLVQVRSPIPESSIAYLSIALRMNQPISEVVIRPESVGLLGGANALRYRFLSDAAKDRPYDLFVEPIVGRGFVTVVQNPRASNGYVGKIRVDDPYDGPADYELRVYVESSQL